MPIRELPSTDLHVTIDAPDGNHYRWGLDGKPQNLASGIQFGTTMPGGFDTGQVTLTRDPNQDYDDLSELATVRFRGAGGVIAGEYRLESAPRTSGDSMNIQPGLVGWQSHLDDDSSAQMIYLDGDLTKWTGPTVARQAEVIASGFIADNGGSVAPDAAGSPSLVTALTGAWSGATVTESFYDGGFAGAVAKLFYAWSIGGNVNSADANWAWGVVVSDDDAGITNNGTANLRAAGPGSDTLTATAGTRRFAFAQAFYGVAAGADGTDYPVYWDALQVIGNHGLALGGSGPYTLLASDIIGHAVSTWAPKLAFTTGSNGSIQASTFQIPQAVFGTTTASAIVTAVAAFELLDWAVWEGPTFYLNARGARGNQWLARSTDVKLQSAGPQIQNLFNGVIVTYQDASGATFSVGPVGSGASTEDASLSDPDPENPANELGIRRWGPNPPLSIGPGSAAAAIQFGQAYLQQQKELNQAGQASHVGYVQEAATGILFPAWAMRAGDQVSYTDLADHSFRRIVSTSYDDASKTNSIQLDSPPETLQALLSRYGVELVNTVTVSA